MPPRRRRTIGGAAGDGVVAANSSAAAGSSPTNVTGIPSRVEGLAAAFTREHRLKRSGSESLGFGSPQHPQRDGHAASNVSPTADADHPADGDGGELVVSSQHATETVVATASQSIPIATANRATTGGGGGGHSLSQSQSPKNATLVLDEAHFLSSSLRMEKIQTPPQALSRPPLPPLTFQPTSNQPSLSRGTPSLDDIQPQLSMASVSSGHQAMWPPLSPLQHQSPEFGRDLGMSPRVRAVPPTVLTPRPLHMKPEFTHPMIVVAPVELKPNDITPKFLQRYGRAGVQWSRVRRVTCAPVNDAQGFSEAAIYHCVLDIAPDVTLLPHPRRSNSFGLDAGAGGVGGSGATTYGATTRASPSTAAGQGRATASQAIPPPTHRSATTVILGGSSGSGSGGGFAALCRKVWMRAKRSVSKKSSSQAGDGALGTGGLNAGDDETSYLPVSYHTDPGAAPSLTPVGSYGQYSLSTLDAFGFSDTSSSSSSPRTSLAIPPPPQFLVVKHYNTLVVESPSAMVRLARHLTATTAEKFASHEIFFYSRLSCFFCNSNSPFRCPKPMFLTEKNRGEPGILRYVLCGTGSGTVTTLGLEDMQRSGFSFEHTSRDGLYSEATIYSVLIALAYFHSSMWDRCHEDVLRQLEPAAILLFIHRGGPKIQHLRSKNEFSKIHIPSIISRWTEYPYTSYITVRSTQLLVAYLRSRWDVIRREALEIIARRDTVLHGDVHYKNIGFRTKYLDAPPSHHHRDHHHHGHHPHHHSSKRRGRGLSDGNPAVPGSTAAAAPPAATGAVSPRLSTQANGVREVSSGFPASSSSGGEVAGGPMLRRYFSRDNVLGLSSMGSGREAPGASSGALSSSPLPATLGLSTADGFANPMPTTSTSSCQSPLVATGLSPIQHEMSLSLPGSKTRRGGGGGSTSAIVSGKSDNGITASAAAVVGETEAEWPENDREESRATTPIAKHAAEGLDIQPCFLDYQSCGPGSIAAELLYFICTSIPVEVDLTSFHGELLDCLASDATSSSHLVSPASGGGGGGGGSQTVNSNSFAGLNPVGGGDDASAAAVASAALSARVRTTSSSSLGSTRMTLAELLSFDIMLITTFYQNLDVAVQTAYPLPQLIRDVYVLARHWAGCIFFDLASSTPQERTVLKRLPEYQRLVSWGERTAERVFSMCVAVFTEVDGRLANSE